MKLKDILLSIIAYGLLYLCFFVFMCVFTDHAAKKMQESISSVEKSRPVETKEVIKPIKPQYPTGIAKEEVTTPIESNTYISIETVEEKNDKIVSSRTILETLVLEVSEKYGVRPELIMAMIEAESTYKSDAQNGECVGLMQVNRNIHAGRAEKLGVTDLFDPYSNILVGVDYFSELLEKYGDEGAALVAYNRGSYGGELTGYAINILNRSYELSIE